MPKKTIFLHTIAIWSAKKQCRHFVSILHHPSPVFLANTTAIAFVLLCNSRFNFHCYTQHEATPTQKLARQWQLQPSTTSSAKDYEGHSLVQSSFAQYSRNTPGAPCKQKQTYVILLWQNIHSSFFRTIQHR